MNESGNDLVVFVVLLSISFIILLNLNVCILLLINSSSCSTTSKIDTLPSVYFFFIYFKGN